MSDDRDLDRVEEALRSMPYLDDDGFTDRVMARLPARHGRRRRVMIGSSAVAAAIAAWSLPGLLGAALDASARATALSPSALLASGAALLVVAAAALGRLLWE